MQQEDQLCRALRRPLGSAASPEIGVCTPRRRRLKRGTFRDAPTISTVLVMVEVRHPDHMAAVDDTQRDIVSPVCVGLTLYVQLSLATRCLRREEALSS